MKHSLSICFVVFFLANFWWGCNNSDSEVTPTLTRQDSLIGNYTGVCIEKEVYLDIETIQYDTLRDTFPSEMKMVDVFIFDNHDFSINTEGLFFNGYPMDQGSFLDDTLFVRYERFFDKEALAIVPKEQLVIRNLETFNTNNANSTFLYCIYMKVK